MKAGFGCVKHQFNGACLFVQLTVQQLVLVPGTDAPMKHHLYHEERCVPRAQPDLSRLRRQADVFSGSNVTHVPGEAGEKGHPGASIPGPVSWPSETNLSQIVRLYIVVTLST